jgi:hypothetical protein
VSAPTRPGRAASRACPQNAVRACQPSPGRYGSAAMIPTDQLVAQALTLATDAFDDDQAVAELRRLAGGNDQALDQAITACMAQPTSLSARRWAIELLARALYE